jgi:hypothetical protein
MHCTSKFREMLQLMRNSSNESDNELIIVVSTASGRLNFSLSSLENFYAISITSFLVGQLSTRDDLILKMRSIRDLAARDIGSRRSLVDLLNGGLLAHASSQTRACRNVSGQAQESEPIWRRATRVIETFKFFASEWRKDGVSEHRHGHKDSIVDLIGVMRGLYTTSLWETGRT